MVLFLELVVAEVVGQSSISIGGLAIFCLHIQSLNSVSDKHITTLTGHEVGEEGVIKKWAGKLLTFLKS